jgi:hypothetical protein
MHFRSGWIAPIAILAIALTAVTLSLADGDHEGVRAADLPFRNVAPLLAADDGSAPRLVTATPTTPTNTPTATPSATPTVAANACGAGHASLIAFADAAAGQLDRTPQPIAPADLLKLTRPTLPAGAVRTGPVETTVYSVDVALVSMTQLPNKTIELIVRDPERSEVNFRVELPDTNCTSGASAEDHGAMLFARTELREACGDPPASGTQALAGTATLTGAGFWGKTGVTGAAVNGIELAPLLKFEFTGTSCDPAHVTPTPIPTQPTLDQVLAGIDVLPVPGVPPGTLVHGVGHTVPPVSGLECAPQYVSPPADGGAVGTVDFDPVLVPKLTGADGTVTWQWVIPADSPPGEGRFEVHCGDKFGVVKVIIS